MIRTVDPDAAITDPAPPAVALADPATAAVLGGARQVAVRWSVGGVVATVVGAGVVVGAFIGPSSPHVVGLCVGGALTLWALAVLYLGVERLRHEGQARRVLSERPWTTVGPYRTRTVDIAGADGASLRTLVAIDRGDHPVLSGRLQHLVGQTGRAPRLAASGQRVRVAGPVGGAHVVGSTDGRVLALVVAVAGHEASRLEPVVAALASSTTAPRPTWRDLRR